MTAAVMQTVTCRCGTTGERPAATGGLADVLAQVSWTCEVCTAEDERAELEHAEQERRRVERERLLEHAETRLKLSTVPATLRRELRELDRGEHNVDAIRAAVAWRDGDLRGLVLTGPVGTGKTSIAAAACWERQLRDRPTDGVLAPTWASVPVMLAKTMSAFTNADRGQALRAITGTDAIALDDLDKLNATEWAATQLFAAIDGRIVEGAPLLITTNLGLDQLATRLGGEYGAAIASRLVGYCRVIPVNGPDRRLP